MLTEAEYLRLLHKEGRCNISEVKEGHERREMILSVGRRSGKTTISACTSLMNIQLISKGDPQGFYGLPSSNVIQLISVATDKDQGIALPRGEWSLSWVFFFRTIYGKQHHVVR